MQLEFSEIFEQYNSAKEAESEWHKVNERIQLDIRLKKNALVEALNEGATTGDPIRDYVIVNKNDSQAAYDRYKQLNEAVVDKVGELFVGFYETRERMIFGGESIESDYENSKHLLCGLLTGEPLRFVEDVCLVPCWSFNFVVKNKSFENSLIGPLTETPNQFKSLLSVSFCTANWHTDHPPHLYNQMSDRVIITAGDQAVLDLVHQGKFDSYEYGLALPALAQIGTLAADEASEKQVRQNMFSKLEELAGRLQLT